MLYSKATSKPRLAVLIAQIAALAMVLAAAGFVTPASAEKPTQQFGCKVTALRIGTTEIAVANPQFNPCEDSEGNVLDLAPTPVEGFIVSAKALLAATDVEPRSSEAAASAVDLVIVGPNFTVKAEQAFFGTKSECVENKQGKPTAQHPSQTATAAGITITTATGETIVLDDEVVGGVHQDVPIPLVGTAHVFHESVDNTRPGHKTDEVTIALLFLDVADPSLPDITLLETKTDFSGQPCAPGQTK